MLETLFEDPAWFFEFQLYRVPAVLIALVLHEWAHGYAAWRLGDPTAKNMGRLSLNPLRHLDPMGTVMMVLVGFGWAKPVPVNPYNFKNPRRDDLLVSLAGIAMNLLLFVFFTLGLCVATQFLWSPQVLEYSTLRDLAGYKPGILLDYSVMDYVLSGYGDAFAANFARPQLLWLVRLCAQVAQTNLYIAIFNLLPVPPLDGSHLLIALLRDIGGRRAARRAQGDAPTAAPGDAPEAALAEAQPAYEAQPGDTYVSQQVARVGMAAVLLLSFTGLLGRGLSFLADNMQAGLLWALERLAGMF